MLLRVVRAMIASGIVASATAGRTMWRIALIRYWASPSRNQRIMPSRMYSRVIGSNHSRTFMRPPVGNHPSPTLNSMMKTSASQKTGMLTPTSAPTMAE